MRVALHRKGRKVRQRGDTLRVTNLANPFEAAANLGDFGIYQVRRVHRLTGVKQHRFNKPRVAGTKDDIDERRCINDDQALSRSLRTASADDMDKVAVGCWANRARNAAIVGRSAI